MSKLCDPCFFGNGVDQCLSLVTFGLHLAHKRRQFL
ncbi:hypothetical protein PF70_01842 [Pseudomonas asplenii]|nr:hypothetical protein PF70_01842 [Pseudomonas fuscovaginae]